MHILFILDPLEQLNPAKDTSLAMMREAQHRGHTLYVAMQHGLYLQDAALFIQAQLVEYQGETIVTGPLSPFSHRQFDAIMMRKDPPFDNEYLYSTHLLEIAANQGTLVLNHPAAVRSWNEKLSVVRFAQFAPPFLVTADNALLREFLHTHHDIVVKPLDGMGGSGIFRLRLDDPNIGVILETATQHGSQTIMAQQYLPQILQGDKRIIVIDGTPVPYALARIPKAGETRGNLAAGGTGVAQVLSPRDLEIATTVGKVLKDHGLFLVGLDVIGDHLTEINVTSPTGMVEIAKQTQTHAHPCQPARLLLEALERALGPNNAS